MTRPRALDLFCGAGGASYGLALAGFEVTGVDVRPQPRYPYRFVQADALTVDLSGYDLIWASPPCQAYSVSRYCHREDYGYPDLVAPIRERVEASETPFILENVPGAPLRADLILCGAMFNLNVKRHRVFECRFPVLQPGHRCWKGKRTYAIVAAHLFSVRVGSAAMGIDWMRRHELAQAVPPAYSQYLGETFLAMGN